MTTKILGNIYRVIGILVVKTYFGSLLVKENEYLGATVFTFISNHKILLSLFDHNKSLCLFILIWIKFDLPLASVS